MTDRQWPQEVRLHTRCGTHEHELPGYRCPDPSWHKPADERATCWMCGSTAAIGPMGNGQTLTHTHTLNTETGEYTNGQWTLEGE